MIDIRNKNCLSELDNLLPNSIDTVITDPPYGLEFHDKGEREYNDVWASGQIIKNAPAFRRVPISDKLKFQKFTKEWAEKALRVTKSGGTLLCFGHPKMWHYLACGLEEAGWQIKETIMWLYSSGYPKSFDVDRKGESKKWDGYKTHALKPSYEPIIMAIKENEGTYIENAQLNNVAGLNIENCKEDNNGKFPSNLIIEDGCIEIKDRFYYVSKPSKKERREYNDHPTVKPLDLMQYLCKLTQTPDGGIVLDPFMGSGTTAVACKNIGRNFIGIEINEHYFKIAEQRINETMF